MSVERAAGSVLDVGIDQGTTAESADVTLVQEIRERRFESCPICGEPATTDEHVPPASMGGRIMTRTCGPCNGRLGSHVEADLADWYNQAVASSRFGSATIPGQRRSGRILWRRTPAG